MRTNYVGKKDVLISNGGFLLHIIKRTEGVKAQNTVPALWFSVLSAKCVNQLGFSARGPLVFVLGVGKPSLTSLSVGQFAYGLGLSTAWPWPLGDIRDGSQPFMAKYRGDCSFLPPLLLYFQLDMTFQRVVLGTEENLWAPTAGYLCNARAYTAFQNACLTATRVLPCHPTPTSSGGPQANTSLKTQ